MTTIEFRGILVGTKKKGRVPKLVHNPFQFLVPLYQFLNLAVFLQSVMLKTDVIAGSIRVLG